MRWLARTIGILIAIAALVLGTGLAFAGLPTPPKHLPTGSGVAAGRGRDVLADGGFLSGGRVAKGWLQEYSTATAPSYLRRDGVQQIAYDGAAGDTGLHRKIEIFQAIWHGVHPGQRWRFSIRVKGKVTRSYVIVGMEWFSVFKHVVGKVVGYGYHYIAEQDVYPQINGSWQRVTAVSPRLPATARCVAVYVQLPEINGSSRIDVQVSGASLILNAGSGARAGAGAGGPS
jgi:hypothetical protein